jgi:acetate kinase
MRCLIPNIGSTSFKYRVLDMPGETILAEGRVERIGQPGGECPDYQSAIAKCLATIAGEGNALGIISEIGAVGFKAVHTGPLSQSQIIGDDQLQAMEEFTFSGGIGENSWETRAAVLKGLSGFGIELDEKKNRAATGLGAISTETSPVKILIVPANEELIVARETVKVVSEARKK